MVIAAELHINMAQTNSDPSLVIWFKWVTFPANLNITSWAKGFSRSSCYLLIAQAFLVFFFLGGFDHYFLRLTEDLTKIFSGHCLPSLIICHHIIIIPPRKQQTGCVNFGKPLSYDSSRSNFATNYHFTQICLRSEPNLLPFFTFVTKVCSTGNLPNSILCDPWPQSKG